MSLTPKKISSWSSLIVGVLGPVCGVVVYLGSMAIGGVEAGKESMTLAMMLAGGGAAAFVGGRVTKKLP